MLQQAQQAKRGKSEMGTLSQLGKSGLTLRLFSAKPDVHQSADDLVLKVAQDVCDNMAEKSFSEYFN